MSTRALWIVACALAVLGAFMLVLKISWLLKVELAWLPYLAHVLGATIAGGAMTRAAPPSSARGAVADAFAAGVLAIGLLALVAFGMPRAFGWIAVRSSHPPLIVAALALGVGAAAAAGAWLFRTTDAAPSTPAILVIATSITACAFLFGGRIAGGLGMPQDNTWSTLFACPAAFASGLLAQTVVPRRTHACGAGMTLLFVLLIAEVMSKPYVELGGTMLLLLVAACLVGFAGAHVARPRATRD